MRLNIYKFIWIGLGLVILAGIGLACYYFANKPAPYNDKSNITKSIPDYQKSQVPGEIVWQASSTSQDGARNIALPSKDLSLLSSDAPISPAVIRAPTEPAIPPDEKNILKLQIDNGLITPAEIDITKNQAVILEVASKKGNYVFYIEGIGIAEIIYEGEPMIISFQAPSRTVTLLYYCEEYETGKKGGEGKMMVQ